MVTSSAHRSRRIGSLPAPWVFPIIGSVILLFAGGVSAQGLLVHLEFEGDVTDSSGNATDGTLVVGSLGGASYTAGPVGQALDMDHDPATITSDKTEGTYVSLPLAPPQEGTIAFWYHVGDLYNYQSLWDTSGQMDDFEMWIYQDGIVRGRVDANVGQVSTTLPHPNRWYHIAYTWKRGDQAHFFIDGAEVDLGSTARGITEAGYDAAGIGTTFFIGGGNPGNCFANGAYDDFRLYDGALDLAGVQALVALGTPPAPPAPDPPSLLFRWDFEGDASDVTGNGFDGEIVAGSLGGYGFEPGPVGQALRLDHDAATLTTDMTEGAFVRVPFVLPVSGSLAFWYRPGPYYNYQGLWDTSGDANDFEMWVYADGIVRGRIDGNVGQVSYQLGRPLEWYHIAYSWKRGDMARIWVNGEEVDLVSPIRGISERQYD
ncbi:MAG: laminin G domain-containing protein, partial [Planctomycetes bacterium]|nr:laminin G domain-containing protein [Planctomycetota bacterium]